MTPERWREIKSVFDELLPLEPSARNGRLSQLAGRDAEMHREVLALLEADAAAGQFLERTPLTNVDQAIDHRTTLPSRIGPYRIVREIGRGGMGVVMLGRRDDESYQKDVAIKVMRAGADTELVRRFTDERQILAQLVHPNIAGLLDGGATEEGQPFLVMEYVDGQPIDVHCDSRQRTIDERLRLFLLVCAAVQHAHQRLVVHRDIKPANILVTAEGLPKLLDFGIAKLIADEGPSATVTLAQMLTPEYASPEQVRGEAITVATDVYALGVVLYRLLTGSRPYGQATDQPHDLARAILDDDPTRPSTAVGRSSLPADATGADAASQRGTTIDRLQRRLAGDLDVIVLKALQKDPVRRYPSADALADDISRYLDGRPVRAHADSLAYRTTKFVRRHRVGVAAAAALVIAIVGGAATTFWQWRVAVANQATAERRFNDVRNLARAVVFDIHDAVADLPGATKARALIVQKGLDYLDAAAREAAGDLSLQLEVASAYDRISEIQENSGRANLGDSDAAIGSAEKALAMREAAARAHPNHLGALRALASSLRQMAYLKTGKPVAFEMMDTAIRIRERILAQSGQPDDQYSLAGEQHVYGQHLSGTDRLSDALSQFERARAGYELRLKTDPANALALEAMSLLLKNTGAVQQVQRRYTEALTSYQRALEFDEKRLSQQPDSVQAKMTVTYSLGSVGGALSALGRHREAITFYRRALAIREELSKSDPANANARAAVVSTHRSIGYVQSLDDPESAIPTYEHALRIAGAVAGQPREVKSLVGFIHTGIGDVHLTLAKKAAVSGSAKADRLRRALASYDHARGVFEALRANGPLTSPEATILNGLTKEVQRLRSEIATHAR